MAVDALPLGFNGPVPVASAEDAERITLQDPGIFNILEPIEFEAVYRGVLGAARRSARDGAKPRRDRRSDRRRARALRRAPSTAFYTGPRLGGLRELPWRNVDFATRHAALHRAKAILMVGGNQQVVVVAAIRLARHAPAA